MTRVFPASPLQSMFNFFLSLLMFMLSCLSFASAATRTVNINNFAFTDTVSNNSTTVINAGDTVQWSWQSGTHSTTSGTCSGPGTCTPDLTWDSTILSSPNTFSFTFNNDGSFPYYCRVHTTAMLAKVIVNPVVTNTNDSGPGSLRQAILDVNANPDLTTITFNIPGGGVHTIAPISPLPAITNPVLIDGYTQPGSIPNSQTVGDNAILLIELRGDSAGSTSGLVVTAGNTTIRGLVINGFAQTGILLQNNGNNVITGNFIGTDTSGAVAHKNGADAVYMLTANNTVGGSTPDLRNVLSGNGGAGANIFEAGATSNQVLGNYIGVSASGTAALGNSSGILSVNASNNTIGGSTAGAGNVIAANTEFGVLLGGSSNTTVQGNLIGTDATGTVALGSIGGVAISGAAGHPANGNTIGGTTPGARNIISGNSGTGIAISGGDSNMIQGNFIGTDVSGNAALGNGNGISIGGATNTFIAVFPGGRNIISGNIADGVDIVAANTNFVSGNFIGTNAAGTAALGNGGNGMTINASGNFIGGPVAGANVISGNGNHGILVSGSNVVQGNFIGTNASGSAELGNAGYGVAVVNGSCPIGGQLAGAGNVISGNALGGVLVSGAAAIGTSLQGNLIGTDATGTVALGNNGNGVSITGGAQSCHIGGTVALARNVISGNVGSGVVITDVNTSYNKVEGNFIGTDITGNSALPNTAGGVLIESQATSNTIGGAGAGFGNVISGNGGSGVVLSDLGTSLNQVDGNFIGTTATGVAALGNAQYGLLIVNGPSGNHVGFSARNIISGNVGAGVVITDLFTTGNVVAGNYIGTNAAGNSAVGNGSGVLVLNGTSANQIGLPGPQANVISGNSGNGVLLSGTGTNGNYLTGNDIGTDAGGTAPIANLGDGVRIDNGAVGNFIGIAGAGNTIAFNAKGVVVAGNTAIGNAIEDNSIFSNTGLGIDLGDDGVTLNTSGGPHTGPNDLQNYPVLTTAVFSGGSLNVNGTFNSMANKTFRLEFFTNSACDASGHGQGKTSLGTQNVTTNGSGNGTFAASFPDGDLSAQAVSATATDPAGNASEFSACQLADFALTNVAGRNLHVRLGKPFTFVVASFTDTDPSGSASQFSTTTIDWGDGTTPSTATIVSTGGQNYNVVGTHAYTKVGGWNVTVTINDSGGATVTATSKARLWPRPLLY